MWPILTVTAVRSLVCKNCRSRSRGRLVRNFYRPIRNTKLWTVLNLVAVQVLTHPIRGSQTRVTSLLWGSIILSSRIVVILVEYLSSWSTANSAKKALRPSW